MIRVCAQYRRERPDGPVITSFVEIGCEMTAPVDVIELEVCRVLDIPLNTLTRPLTRQCAGASATSRKGCAHYVDVARQYCGAHLDQAQKPLRVATARELRVHESIYRALNQNEAYRAYARVSGMTVRQRLAADDYNTDTFDLWLPTAKQRFGQAYPQAYIPETKQILSPTLWTSWLSNLTPETMPMGGFV